MNVKFYGYGYPPYGLIQVLDSINFTKDIVCYLHDPLSGLGALPFNEIADQDKENLFVVLQTGEGHSHTHFDILLDKLINKCKVIPEHITIYSGCLYDPDSPVHSIGTIVPHIGVTLGHIDATQDYINSVPTHHYVCLNRQPRWERYRIVESLLDLELDIYGKISYATAPATTMELQTWPMKYKDRFPMIVDKESVEIPQGFDISPAISGALFNIVTESSFDIQPGHWAASVYHSHGLPTLSEKTYKAFILGQIPILVSPRYTVRILREFGFDVFDDIVDHGYDLVEDPEQRIQLVVEQVQNLCTKDIVALKKSILPRLTKNLDMLKYYAYNHMADKPRWADYFNKLGVA